MKNPTTAKADQSGLSKSGGAAGASGQSMDESGATAQPADELLKADHRKVEQLFKKFESLTDQGEKAECAKEICKELIVHSMLEEEIFYPACRQKGVKSDMLDEAQVEHDGAKVLIRELMSEEADAEFYDAKVSVLCEYIKHHVGEEEKGSEGIFALAKKAGVDMNALGKELQARKAELTQEFEQEQLPAPEYRSLQAIETGNARRQENKMGRYESEGRGSYRSGGGGRSSGRERDEYGRFTSDDDDRGYAQERSSRGRYDDERDDRGYASRGRSGSQDRDRDEYGRFTSDDDRGSRGRSSYAGGRSRYEDDEGRDQGRGGWFGDSEGHSDASRRGWDSRGGSSRSGGSRYEDDGDYRSSGSSSGGRSRYDDDDNGSSRYGRSRYEDDDRGRGQSQSQSQGGWFGDSEGHSEAARRGWENRGSSGRSRSSDDDDDRRGSRSSSGGRSGGSSSREQGHGGWFGDSRGHAEAARRGWRNRD